MVVERVTFKVRKGREAEFERHQAEWDAALRRTRGFIGRVLMRNADDPLEYQAEIRWVSRAHRDRFAAAADRDAAALRQAAAALVEGTPASRLYEPV
jgi:heme-degrading monooxygenase HmoA